MGLNRSAADPPLTFLVASEPVSLLMTFISQVTALQWCVSLVTASAAWLWWYRHSQTSGLKRWPLIGSTIELVANWDRMHDWLWEHFSEDRTTIEVSFASHIGGAVYTVDPANVEYLLKANFANYPKVSASSSSSPF